MDTDHVAPVEKPSDVPLLPAGEQRDVAPEPPARPHEPGARPMPLSRLLYP
ncbi:hypothetical protein [Streptomyces sp. NPDC015680]|uniref:hypothetical protein n=1 Tax=Streptomyces sp. NPDC015680 TaxID=3364962 RepID=UPI0036F8118E